MSYVALRIAEDENDVLALIRTRQNLFSTSHGKAQTLSRFLKDKVHQWPHSYMLTSTPLSVLAKHYEEC